MTPIDIGFIPLVDAAPLIIAKEMGFDKEEGLTFNLIKAPSWSAIRDLLAHGSVTAAHMLAPIPIASALGLGAQKADLSALMVLSINGNVIGVNTELERQLLEIGHRFDYKDAKTAGHAFAHLAKQSPLKIGVPFPFSMHAELLYYWLGASGLKLDRDFEVKTIPPPLMADAIASGEITAFCVGEPWGSKTVERGLGALVLPCSAIWSFAPEKVLAVRTDWTVKNQEMTGKLMRAVWRASRWLGTSGTQTTTAEILSSSYYLNLQSELIDRALTGSFAISQHGDARTAANFLYFFDGAANFPWRSQAAWIGTQLACRLNLDANHTIEKAKTVFRSDLFRLHLRETGAILPSASQKLEGSTFDGFAAASESGRLIFNENRFFDGKVFDPMIQQ